MRLKKWEPLSDAQFSYTEMFNGIQHFKKIVNIHKDLHLLMNYSVFCIFKCKKCH